MVGCAAVTGIGVISSIGHDISEFTQSLRDGRCGIRATEPSPGEIPVAPVRALIRNFAFEKTLESKLQADREVTGRLKSVLKRSNETMKYAAISALEAWNGARFSQSKLPRSERMGIVVAGSNLSTALQYRLHERFSKAPEYLSPTYALQFLDTDYVGTLSEIFQLKGEGFTVGGASASGNVAIIKACQLLQLGLLDVCLVVGCCSDLSPMEIQGFINLGGMGGIGRVEPSEACRPFDQGHEGFIYGQAAACLILESITHARDRKANILSYIRGGAIGLDANRLSNPCEAGEVRVMEEAMRLAGVERNQIDYINAHGTSTPLGDITEINAIKNVFGDRMGQVWINSTKGLTGHCLFAAGILEAIAVTVQMQEGFLHPNLNLNAPIDRECKFCGPRAIDVQSRLALSNSFGFGGINTSIVIESGVNF